MLSPVFVVLRCACIASACLLLGCSAQNSPGPSRTSPVRSLAAGAGATTPEAPSGVVSGSAGTGDSNPLLTTPPPQPTLTTTLNTKDPTACVSTMAMAPPPANPAVDIIWVVDASGSMLDEQMKIGANLTAFADKITQANIDVHIVMMTTSAAIPVICPVTPEDPLTGSALATDPRYKFISSLVDSHNALDIALGNFGMYQSFLRPGAATHFVIVTDDESTYKRQASADARANMFLSDMRSMLGHDFFLHTVASEGPAPCRDPNCMPDPNTGICVFVMLGCGAAAPGTTYYTLADMTKGLKASICESDWKSIFEPLSAAVIKSAPLPCNYQIPKPPSGDSLDASKVNVSWQGTGGMAPMVFGKAANGGACQDQLGWYYDASPPTQIMLCPKTCDAIAAGGTLSIGFGCATFELR